MPSSFFDGVKKGYVTRKGKADHSRIGAARRKEYVVEKKFLSEKFNPEEILSLSTFVQRCATSGQYLLRGLYPLEEIQFDRDVDYLSEPENSPLTGTTYAQVLSTMSKASNKCPAGPVMQIPHNHDVMFHTRNCKSLHEFLSK